MIAELRYHSQFSGIKLSFKMIDIEKLIDKKALTIINSALIPHLNSRQIVNGPCLPKTAIADAAATCKQARCSQGSVYFSDPLLLCRGHDLMEILAIGFRSLFGTRTASESSRENIESLFRLNYSRHFKSSALAQSINTWLRLHALHPQVMID